MDEQQNIAPIDHSTLSATGATAAGAAGGALKGGAMTALAWIAGLAVLGVLAGAFMPAILGALTGHAAASAVAGGVTAAAHGIGSLLTSGAFWGGLAGLAVGLVTWQIPTIIGAGIGGVSGGKKAADRVAMEREQAMALQMQIAQAQSASANPYQISPEEYAMMQARMRGGDGVRADHAERLQAAAAEQPQQRSA